MVLPPFTRYVDALAWLLVSAVFLLDLRFPQDYAAHLLYVGVILLGLWSPRLKLSFAIAAAGTLLSALDYFLKVPGADPTAAWFNRAAGIAVFWVTAAGVATYRRTVAQREEQQQRSLEEVSARLQAEEASRQLLKDLKDIKYALDQSAIIATTNVQGDITYVNDKFCEISKYSRHELIGRNHRLLNSGLHPLEFFKEMYHEIANGRVWRGEIRNRAKDGTLYWVDTTIVPFLDDTGKPSQYTAIRYDITERKKSEAALRDQAALAQLGKMAAVVAHEVRNPLAGIRGALQVIGQRLPADSREHGITHEIITRIDTLNDIVQDLLLFARPRQPVLAEVAFGTVVQETVSLLREDPTLQALVIDVRVDDVTVHADPELLKLALLNLLMNGAQAMHGQGTLTVASSRMDGWHELRIIDQGPGISAEIREHLFEPFFTTKHRGTGLGLATTRRIVEAHGGQVTLECPPAGGTTAIVRLPIKT